MSRDREVRKQYVKDYLETHSCIDCGLDDIRVLEFDHRDPDDKSFTIAYAIGHVGLQRLQEEMDKCDVRCANCHTRRHYEEG